MAHRGAELSLVHHDVMAPSIEVRIPFFRDVPGPRKPATASHLTSNGVAPRTAQQFMRHSTYDLTANGYTDPQLLDLTTAFDALPKMRGESPDDSQTAVAS